MIDIVEYYWHIFLLMHLLLACDLKRESFDIEIKEEVEKEWATILEEIA